MNPQNGHPRLSVVIPAYNERLLLPAALEAVEGALAAAGWREVSEVVVCDNASTDETAELAAQRGARVVREPRRNIAAVRNTGARAACGEWLIFTDADSQVSPGLLAETLLALEDPHVVAGGSLVAVQSDHPRARRAVALWNWLSTRKSLAAGGYIFCRKADFDAIGGFDDSFYAGEELDFTRRMKALGRRTGRRFVILTRHPLLTSARKLDYPLRWSDLFKGLLFALGCDRVAKNPRNCGMWYDVDR
ncbi:glycosyltransferase [bacterium]|nr:glycosyltransferase [bacterium]